MQAMQAVVLPLPMRKASVPHGSDELLLLLLLLVVLLLLWLDCKVVLEVVLAFSALAVV